MRQLVFTGLLVASLSASATPRSQCSKDADCAGECAARAMELAGPQPYVETFAHTECRPYNSDKVMTTGCACLDESFSGHTLHGVVDAGCAVTGRTGDCLFSPEEFQSCIDDAGTNDALCEPQCATFGARKKADALRQLNVSVTGTACSSTFFGGTCWCAYQVEDRCFTPVRNGGSGSYDCRLDGNIALREALGGGCGCGSAPGAVLVLAALLSLISRRPSALP